MADIETGLVLRLEASLAKFEKQMARARQAGRSMAEDTERRFASSNKKMAASAERSAQAIGKEMDRLRAKYDPLFAASKRYEAELDELNRAQKVGALTTRQYEAALENLNSEYARAGRASTQVGKATRGMGGGIQNVAFQVGDFATQVGAGTAASVALGQQLPQLLGGFGVLGAVMGAVVAIGVPLAAALFRDGEEAKTLSDRLDDLNNAVEEYRSAVDRAIIPTADLEEKYGTATAAAREFIRALREVSEANALDEANAALTEIARQFGTFEDRAQGPMQMNQGFTNLTRTISEMAKTLGIAEDMARDLAPAFEALDKAEGAEARTRAAKDLLQALEAALGPAEDMTAAQRETYEQIARAADMMAQFVGVSQQAAGGLSTMASEAGRVADELGRAVDNAINLANQGISDVRRAEIEWEYRDDPVGREVALRLHRYDQDTKLPADAPGFVREQVNEGDIQARRAVVADSARRVAELNGRLSDWRREQANSGGSSGGGSGAGDPGLFAASDRQILGLERNLEMLGKTQAEVAALNAEYQLLDEAKRRGLNLDQRLTASGRTLAEEIKAQASEVGALTIELDRQEESLQRIEAAAGAFGDTIGKALDIMMDRSTSAADKAEALKDVLLDLAAQMVKMMLIQPFLDSLSGGMSSLFGGGSFLAGTRATGGPVQGGKTYLVGERGPELFTAPSTGQIIPNNVMRGFNAASAQQAQIVYVPQPYVAHVTADDDGRISARMEMVAREQATSTVAAFDKVLPDRVMQISNQPRRR